MKIDFQQHSGLYSLRSKQELPISLEKSWDFFTKASNLAKITPAEMAFQITSPKVERTYLGQIITYKIGFMFGIKSNWVTEITQFEKEKFFIDEQRFGPYAMWHHEHHFEALPNGNTLMTDIIHYKLPLGILGNFFMGAFIRNKVKAIFDYRFKIIDEFFSIKKEQN